MDYDLKFVRAVNWDNIVNKQSENMCSRHLWAKSILMVRIDDLSIYWNSIIR